MKYPRNNGMSNLKKRLGRVVTGNKKKTQRAKKYSKKFSS